MKKETSKGRFSDPPPRSKASPAGTFQGRRIVEIEWRGKPAAALEGLFSFKAVADKQLPPAFEGPKRSRIRIGTLDRLGIGLLEVEQPREQAERITFEQLEKLLDSYVQWVEPVLVDHLAMAPSDPDFVRQWGLRAINAEQGWQNWSGDAESVVLAVLDSGAPIQQQSLSHPDLQDANRFFLGPDIANFDQEPADDHGHGTHVLGIATATRDNSRGIAGLWPGLVFVIKCFNDQAFGTDVAFKDGVFEALDFAKTRPGVKLVINYSGEGPETSVREEAVTKARDEGALIVAPAGNGSAVDSIAFPAAYSTLFDNVVAVAGVNSVGQRVPTSNQGPGLTVAAPGARIHSTMPNYFVQLNNAGLAYNYASMGGTSMAAAFVSGLAALVWSVCPGLTPAQVRERIASTAGPVPPGEFGLGRGIINAALALQGLKESLCPDEEPSDGEQQAPSPSQQT